MYRPGFRRIEVVMDICKPAMNQTCLPRMKMVRLTESGEESLQAVEAWSRWSGWSGWSSVTSVIPHKINNGNVCLNTFNQGVEVVSTEIVEYVFYGEG